MFKRQPGKSAAKEASAYSRRSAVADSVWDLQDRLRRGGSAAAGRLVEGAAWSLEQISYTLRKRLLWPAEDRADGLGRPARALAGATVVLLAAAAGVAGLIWAAPDGPHKDAGVAAATNVPRPLAVVRSTPEHSPQSTLQGAAPSFRPDRTAAAASEVDPARAIVSSAPAGTPPAAAETATTSSAQPSSSASTSAARAATDEGPPAGPRALAVAGDFAAAFVRYETGDSSSGVRTTFGETATPALAKALLRRPPRLPANVKVPQAKVLNVVPAPSRGAIYPVSVSLLRVGLTSELRLEMEKRKADGWRVTNVLG